MAEKKRAKEKEKEKGKERGKEEKKEKPKAKAKKKKSEQIITTGKRKRAIARASVKPGKGRVMINSKPLELWGTEVLRLWMKEPLVIGESVVKSTDIDISVQGGGIVAQAEACRQAVARGLVEFSKDKNLKKTFLDFDRNILVYDPRRTEPHKPSRSKQGARRHKQRSKR